MIRRFRPIFALLLSYRSTSEKARNTSLKSAEIAKLLENPQKLAYINSCAIPKLTERTTDSYQEAHSAFRFQHSLPFGNWAAI
jgi:hypothetical protein